MALYVRKFLAAGLAMTLLFVGLVSMSGTSSAANLSNGTNTYVIGGEEVAFPFDPVKLGGGTLLPLEVFQKIGVSVDSATPKSLTLKKGGQTVKATLGSTVTDVNGAAGTVTGTPVRLNGRLFLPADLMKEFGWEYTIDGTYVVLTDNSEAAPVVKTTSDSDWTAMRSGKTFTASVKTDANVYVNAEFTLLTAEMLSASSLDVTWNTRLKLANSMKNNTLVLVKLSNAAYKAGALVTANLWLVDDVRNQYEVTSVMDIGKGLINAKLAPGADRLGVLVFPKLSAQASVLNLYYDSHSGVIGGFSSVR